VEVRSGLTPRGGAIPSVLAGLVAFAAIAGFALTRNAVARPNRQEAQTVASAQAAAISAHLKTDAALLAAASQALAGVPTRPADLSQLIPDDPAAAVGVATASATGVTVLDTVLSASTQTANRLRNTDLAALPEWRLALELARDGGGTVAAAAAGPTSGLAVIEAQALYGQATGLTQVADRRQALEGYVVLIEPATSLSGLAAGDAGAHLAVRLVQGTVTLNRYGAGGAASPTGAPATAPVSANGTNWVVQVWSVGRPSKSPWVILIGGLVVAGVVGIVAALAERKSDRLAKDAAARANELGLVARTGPLLQQSLDLAELLPLFVVEVSDELGLESMAIALVSDSGELVRAFSLGRGKMAPERDVAAMASIPASVAAGGTITVPLQRAGRIVGALSAEAPDGLEPSQLGALRAVCDLLAAALGNARLFQEEQDMVVKLRELDRLKTTFLGSVSHELRTTVTAIEGFAGLLTTQSALMDDERRMDFIGRIRRNARSLGVLVEDLLDFARMEGGGLSTTVQPVDLSDHVPKVIEQMSSILGERRVDVVVAPGVVAAADPSAIERILANLLSNAAKYTPPDAPVEVSLGHEDGMAVLCVSDRGPGIPPEERERIFDLFYRVDNEAARGARGVGIGLALVRQLVELLHGSITADEPPGGGARFRVTIPLLSAGPIPYEPRVTQHVSPT
jgi:signal transduction histidine kinase